MCIATSRGTEMLVDGVKVLTVSPNISAPARHIAKQVIF